MKRSLIALVLSIGLLSGCGLKLRDFVEVVPPPVAQPAPVDPAPVDPPKPVEPAPVEPAPVEPPKPVEEPKPFQNLNIVVNDVDTKEGIGGATVENLTISETRSTDGSGFANFGVQDSSRLRVSAQDYAPETRDNVAPGNVRFELKSTKPKPVTLHGVRVGPGGRAAAGGPLPHMLEVLRAVAHANVSALNRSCQELPGGSWDFMDRAVDVLRTYDTRFGYNGKRGNANDPSKDAIAYNFGAGPDEGSTSVYIIDIVGGHCGPVPSPTWNDVTEITIKSGTIGRWVSRGRF